MATQRTALHEAHAALGARFTEFGGWEMPVRYGSIIDEHQAVRTVAGLFDLSHMGELHVGGPGAAAGLAAALVTVPGRLAVGRAGYSLLCATDGGVIDDLIVYRLGDEAFLVVPNAANRELVAEELRTRLAGFEAELDDRTLATSLVAIQGPRAATILAGLTSLDLSSLRNYSAVPATVAHIEAVVARTGYTGEDGFELYVEPSAAPGLWRAILDRGQAHDLVPAGLGARDTLRFEAGMSLYGHDIDNTTTPLEANLGWIVKFKKGDYIGRDVLERQKEEGVERKLVGFEMFERGIARHGYPVLLHEGDTEPVSHVTSGTQSPTLGRALGMTYLPIEATEVGTEFFVQIRNRTAPARVVEMPFYSRKKD